MSIRIIKIEAKNFRVFGSRPLKIDLTATGKNLLVYGENGSGKSSVFLALKDFLECAERDASKRNVTVFPYRNIFATTDDGFVKIELTGLPRPAQQSKSQKKRPMTQAYEWSNATDNTNDQLILEINKTKGFIDYKALLATYFLHQDQDTVNIFKLLMGSVLENVENDITNRKFGEEWNRALYAFENLNYRSKTAKDGLTGLLKEYSDGLIEKLKELQAKAKEILDTFGYNLDLEIGCAGISFDEKAKEIRNQKVILKVKSFGQDRDGHHLFLNEAKLSAIAISIFFAALLLQPESRLRILALDDVLIGLDMSNRLPVLDILKQHFSEYQIFFFTYDRAWYEIVKLRFTDWATAEFFAGKTDERDFSIYNHVKSYLEVSKQYLADHDYKAAMVYLRTHFEMILKKFCDKKKLAVTYHILDRRYTSENFWEAAKLAKKTDSTNVISALVVAEIELYRTITINELCHASFVGTNQAEVAGAIAAVEALEVELVSFL
ncbi:MAG TPA: AAA family ATPase [Pyrinomonadaceae bacterium]|nr:AAA family ATPase [Chloracidobacterium sp.]MBL0239170.1 AAA family ATPase [Chloracidobacterium sp.]MBP9936219.1 AAA family ATPase [Pyrinomonadaceae bacterium]HQY67131.1 AAA family ATPase [Pyrinomonadaceae bacterium]